VKIAAIEISRHSLPLDPPYLASFDSKPRTRSDTTVVRITTDEGVTGVGAGYALQGFEGCEDLFIGQDPLALERHYRVLNNLQFANGRPWTLDIALWDLAGKITGQPVWKLLGGLSDRCLAYASSGSLRGPDETADLAEHCVQRGFRAMKIRFRRPSWRDDVAVVAAVRERVRDRLELMVDCNQGWMMPWDAQTPWQLKDALAVAQELEELSVYWLEEPLHRGDVEGMAALRQATSLRIAGGEGNLEVHELQNLIQRRCLDVLQPDVTWCGGITGLRRIAILAQENHLMFTPHAWTVGVGLLANVHLAAGLAGSPYVEFPYDPPGWTPERRDYALAQPVDIDDNGFIVLSHRPGLGFDLDEERLAMTRVG
jgi:L-alanine-DL-glutamate epimerase-like enolase superfamily enzyme